MNRKKSILTGLAAGAALGSFLPIVGPMAGVAIGSAIGALLGARAKNSRSLQRYLYVRQYMQVATLIYCRHQNQHMHILGQQQGKQQVCIKRFQSQDVLIADV